MYNFFLQKNNEQSGRETTTFLLQELVANGLYANKDTAYKGIKSITDKMMKMSIEGIQVAYEGKKKKQIRNAKAVLIAQRDISYNACSISLPPIIRNHAKFITILPTWAYTLSENGFMLLDYIFYMARQYAEKIADERHFNISLEAIRVHLGLPTPEQAGTDPKRLIIDPIEKAIEDIEDGRRGTDIYITPYYNPDYKNVREYLQGYLKIELDAKATAYMEKIAGLKKQRLTQAAKRREKARLQAQTKLETERLNQTQLPAE